MLYQRPGLAVMRPMFPGGFKYASSPSSPAALFNLVPGSPVVGSSPALLAGFQNDPDIHNLSLVSVGQYDDFAVSSRTKPLTGFFRFTIAFNACFLTSTNRSLLDF